jgi:hypothetical protein
MAATPSVQCEGSEDAQATDLASRVSATSRHAVEISVVIDAATSTAGPDLARYESAYRALARTV